MTRASNVEIFSGNFRATIGIVSPTLRIDWFRGSVLVYLIWFQRQEIELEIESASEKGKNSILIEALGHETPEEQEFNDQIMKTLVDNGYKVKYSVWCIVARPLLSMRISW